MDKQEMLNRVVRMEERIGELYEELSALKQQVVELIEENTRLKMENQSLREWKTRLQSQETMPGEEAEKKVSPGDGSERRGGSPAAAVPGRLSHLQRPLRPDAAGGGLPVLPRISQQVVCGLKALGIPAFFFTLDERGPEDAGAAKL